MKKRWNDSCKSTEKFLSLSLIPVQTWLLGIYITVRWKTKKEIDDMAA